jgi:hypothetical protein
MRGVYSHHIGRGISVTADRGISVVADRSVVSIRALNLFVKKIAIGA